MKKPEHSIKVPVDQETRSLLVRVATETARSQRQMARVLLRDAVAKAADRLNKKKRQA